MTARLLVVPTTGDRESRRFTWFSAWANKPDLTLAQQRTDEKSNEITAIPELLRMLEMQGCIVTIAAIGTQTAIAEQIVDQGGDYVLALKGNKSTPHEDVELYLRDIKPESAK